MAATVTRAGTTIARLRMLFVCEATSGEGEPGTIEHAGEGRRDRAAGQGQ